MQEQAAHTVYDVLGSEMGARRGMPAQMHAMLQVHAVVHHTGHTGYTPRDAGRDMRAGIWRSRPSLDVTECLSPTTDSKAAPQTPVLEETSPESSSSPTGVQEFAYDGGDKDTKGKLSMENLQPESPVTIRMESLTIE